MYEIFERLLKEKGLKGADVTRATGITSTTLSFWKQGRSTPKIDKLQKIADFLGVSLQYLTTGKDDKFPLPDFDPDYIKVISLYGKLDDADKATVMNLMESLSKKG